MKEIVGNIWDYKSQGWIVIPTNGYVKTNGKAVMGRGLALQASKIYPSLPSWLGLQLKHTGNHVRVFGMEGLITFPVKHNWWEKADYNLICRSCEELQRVMDDLGMPMSIFMPRVGCGNGQLNWHESIKEIIEHYFKDRSVTVVDLKGDLK